MKNEPKSPSSNKEILYSQILKMVNGDLDSAEILLESLMEQGYDILIEEEYDTQPNSNHNSIK